MAQFKQYETGDGADAAHTIVFIFRRIDVERYKQIVQLVLPVDKQAAVFPGHNLRFLTGVTFGDVAHQATEDIIDGDDTLKRSVLVKYNGLMDFGSLEFVQYTVCRTVFVDVIQRLRQAFQTYRFVNEVLVEQRFDMHHAGDVIQSALTNRIDRMATFQYGIAVHIVPVIDIKPHDVAAVRHQVDGALIAQTEYPVYDFMLNVLDGTGVGALVNECLYLFFGNCVMRRFDVQSFNNAFGGGTEQPYEWRYGLAEHLHRKGKDHRIFLRDSQPDTLGHEFAKHQGKKRDNNHHDEDG